MCAVGQGPILKAARGQDGAFETAAPTLEIPRVFGRSGTLTFVKHRRKRLVTGGVWLQAASGYGQRLVTDGVWLQTASGYGPRLGTGGVWLRAASG